jgi:hypothetical protein
LLKHVAGPFTGVHQVIQLCLQGNENAFINSGGNAAGDNRYFRLQFLCPNQPGSASTYKKEYSAFHGFKYTGSMNATFKGTSMPAKGKSTVVKKKKRQLVAVVLT